MGITEEPECAPPCALSISSAWFKGRVSSLVCAVLLSVRIFL